MSHDVSPDPQGRSADLGNLTDRSRFKAMVRWFTPGLLAQAGFRSVVASLFGQYADQRTTQHLTDPIPDPTDEGVRSEQRKTFAARYDYSGECIGEQPFWADFAADMGDGFDSTYSMAHLISADHLYPEKKAVGLNAKSMEIYGLNGGEALPGGRVLVLGGDEVYPWPSREEYDDRFCRPYQAAFPAFDKTGEGPDAARTRRERDMFAIPGNHDWYDGLGAFDDLFCKARGNVIDPETTKIGGWQTRQHRSYFAIKLPHNWWIWGADVQLGRYLDSGQIDYFRTIAEQMGPQDKFILCTAQPSWYYFGTDQESLARSNLRGIIDLPIMRGAKLCGIFSGDSHHYSRYNETEQLGNFNLFTAGGGGAYAHGTHHLKDYIDFFWIDRIVKFSLNRKLKPGRPGRGARADEHTTPDTSGNRPRIEPKAVPAGEATLAQSFVPPAEAATGGETAARSPGAAPAPDAGAAAGGAPPSMAFATDAANPPIATHMKPRQTNQAAAYPTKSMSRILSWGNFGFPFRNKSFALAIGLIYLLLTWTFSVLNVQYAVDFNPAELSGETLENLRDKLGTRGGLQTVRPDDNFQGPMASPEISTQVKSIADWSLDIIDVYISRVKNFGIISPKGFEALRTFFVQGLHLLLLGIVFSPAGLAFLLALWGIFVTIAESRWQGRAGRISRLVLGTGHFLVHLTAMWLLFSLFLHLNVNVLKPWFLENVGTSFLGTPIEVLVPAATFIEMIPIGGLVGGLIFGLYLTLGYRFFKINADWVFSAQRLKGYKCFLRMKFEPDRLTIYPIGLHTVPSSGRWSSAWMKAKPDGTSRSLLRPRRKLRPHLIEGPIVIDTDEVRNFPRG